MKFLENDHVSIMWDPSAASGTIIYLKPRWMFWLKWDAIIFIDEKCQRTNRIWKVRLDEICI